MMSVSLSAYTLPQLLLKHAAENPNGVGERHKRLGIWQQFTWLQIKNKVLDLACGFDSIGVRAGDTVTILGDNEPEALWAELAAQSVGAKSVSLYPDISGQELAFVCADADTRFVVAQDQEQVDKCLALPNRDSMLGIAYWDATGLWSYHDKDLLSLDQIATCGANVDRGRRERVLGQMRAAEDNSIALLSYTSGTTGTPKGVIFTHRFLLDNAERLRGSLGLRQGDEHLSYVPFAWATEQVFGVALGLTVPLVVNFPERPDTVPANMRELALHCLFLGARQWEGLARTVQMRVLDAPKWQRSLCNCALRTAERIVDKEASGQALTLMDRLKRLLAEWTTLRGIRDQLGLTRVRAALMGGAPMAPDVFRFFNALGVKVRNVYGCTEMGLLTAHIIQKPVRAGTMGSVLPVHESYGEPIQLRLDESGQLLVRGASGFKGYWNRPDKTAERLMDGWFLTGDVVYRNADSELIFVDRLEDMRSLADGTPYSPQFIETRLRFSPFVKDLLVAGDQTRPYVIALINIDSTAVGRWAEANRVPFSGFADLSQCAEVVALVRAEIRRVNAFIPEKARVRKFANLPKELDADEGELTRTRKLRREFVEKRYASLIESLFGKDKLQKISMEVLFQDGTRGIFSADVRLEEVGL